VLCAVVALPSASATAATLTYALDVLFAETAPGEEPAGPGPWVTITFDDSFGGANTVRVTMEGSGLSGGTRGENIHQIYLNFDPLLDATLITFSAVDNADSIPNGIFTGADSFMANGDGNYDILFDFPPPPGNAASRFTQGESVIYDLTYVSPIDVNSFNFFSVEMGGQGSYLAAAHLQRTPDGGNGSAWVGFVPQPSTAALLGMGLAGLAFCGRRRKPR
jgi:hypothetical protein